MTVGNSPIAADGLPLVAIGNDIWASESGAGGGRGEVCLMDKIR